MTVGRFLAGIGALIWDADRDKYLILRRSAEKDFAAGAWECVTGRVDQGESFEGALYREVQEELGIDIQPLFMIGTTHFFRGESRPENELLGLVYCCSAVDASIRNGDFQLSAEHDAYRWVTADQAQKFLSEADPTERWLRKVIERAELTKKILPDELLTLHLKEGFELDT